MKWIVRKCKKPSTRWVAWRASQKRRSGIVLNSWIEAIRYAVVQSEADRKLRSLR